MTVLAQRGTWQRNTAAILYVQISSIAEPLLLEAECDFGRELLPSRPQTAHWKRMLTYLLF